MSVHMAQQIVEGVALVIALGVVVFIGLVTRPWNIRNKPD